MTATDIISLIGGRHPDIKLEIQSGNKCLAGGAVGLICNIPCSYCIV